MKTKRGVHPEHIFNSVADHDRETSYDQKLTMTNHSELTLDEQKLARIWIQYSHLFQNGLYDLGVGDISKRMVPNYKAAPFVRQLKQVYPDYWSHYENRPENMPLCPVTVGGKEYANLVHLARSLANGASRAVERVQTNAERELIFQLKAAARLPEGRSRLRNLRKLFRRFYSYTAIYSADSELKKRFEELRDLYGITKG
jgi:hypothetical protein